MTIEEVELVLKELRSNPWIQLPYEFAYLNTKTGEKISGGRIAKIETKLKRLKEVSNDNN